MRTFLKRMTAGFLCLAALMVLKSGWTAAEEWYDPDYIIDELYDPAATEGMEARLPGPVEWTEEERAGVILHGTVLKDPSLDAALPMLEEGNPFLERYNLITGSMLTPYLPAGIPYFIGGRDMNTILRNMPTEYVLWYAWQNSLYYRDGAMYFYGLDCVGFIRKVWTDILNPGFVSASDLLWNSEWRHIASGFGRDPQGWEEWARLLNPGDVLVTQSSHGFHMMMFMGTLRSFGYTAEEIPRLSEYLDYPLVIHCGVNAAYADRFYALKQTGPWRYSLATVPDGGVTVSLLGAAWETAPCRVHQQLQDTAWYPLPDGTWLTVIDWSQVNRWCWCR